MDETRFYIPEIKKTFHGKIVDKYYTKSPHLKISTTTETEDIFNVSDTLMSVSKIGDSIYKLENENYVILLSRGSHFKLEYMFIPPSVLHSHRWPKELKAK
ncbi:MAG TPA: hypothetical protein VGG71_13460 [Chitinophagaceae bacterium]